MELRLKKGFKEDNVCRINLRYSHSKLGYTCGSTRHNKQIDEVTEAFLKEMSKVIWLVSLVGSTSTY